jgi:hypothetical protein
MNTDTHKRCSKCGIETKRSRFNKRKAAKDGLCPHCKICQSIDYDIAKQAGKVKPSPCSGPEFVKKYGVAYTTFRDWLVKEYDNDKSPYWQLKQIPQDERVLMVSQYKKWRKVKKARAAKNRRIRG